MNELQELKDNFPSNSNKSKEKAEIEPIENDRKIKRITVGKQKKKSEIRKFTDVFLADDLNSVKDYILEDVIIPSIKKGIVDIVSNGIDMLMYGESGHKANKSTNAGRVSYRSYYESDSRSEPSYKRSRKTTYDFDDVVIPSRGEAEEVLDIVNEMMEQYRMVTVASFYELVGVTDVYTDHQYGWTLKAYPNFFRDTRIIRTRDGYIIKFPRIVPID